MTYNQAPEEFRLNRIIAVYDTVACVNYGFCIWQREIALNLQYTVYGFSHYLCFSLYCTLTEIVFFEDIVTHIISDKETFELINRSLDIE